MLLQRGRQPSRQLAPVQAAVQVVNYMVPIVVAHLVVLHPCGAMDSSKLFGTAADQMCVMLHRSLVNLASPTQAGSSTNAEQLNYPSLPPPKAASARMPCCFVPPHPPAQLYVRQYESRGFLGSMKMCWLQLQEVRRQKAIQCSPVC